MKLETKWEAMYQYTYKGTYAEGIIRQKGNKWQIVNNVLFPLLCRKPLNDCKTLKEAKKEVERQAIIDYKIIQKERRKRENEDSNC